MTGAPRHAVATVLLLVAVVLAGCTVGPSQRPPVAVRGENMPAPPAPLPLPEPVETLPEPQEQDPSISFFPCTEDVLATLPTPIPPDRTLQVECGEITVPADADEPGLGGVSLDVLRVGLAGAPANRPPLLVLGDSAGEPSARHAVVLAGQVAPALLERFTLVGLDRRGAGSDLLDCAPDTAVAALVDTEPVDETALAGLLEDARAIVQECTIELGGGLTTFRTAATAADVELLRAGLGVERLSAIGVGDGAAALSGWARVTPQAVGRLVLDGPPSPTLGEPERSEAHAEAAEAAFGAFAAVCTARPDCPLGADPRATVSALVEQLRGRPLAAVDGSRLTAGGAVAAVLTGLAEPRGWPALAAALAAATAGDPAPLLAVLAPVTGPRGLYDGMLATACNDVARRFSPGEVAEVAARWRTAYPLVGGAFAVRLLACAPWPTGGAPAPPGQAHGAPPILVVGTAADPRAPLDGSRQTADSLATARFLSWQGAGSGAYPRTPCVNGTVEAMLIDGVVPAPGGLCPP